MQSSSELFTYAATTPLRGMALLPSHYWAATKDHLLQILGQFPSIGLAQMEAVALMDRTDVKYMLTAHQLQVALKALSLDYWVLVINGVRMSGYETVYFDTPEFALYLQHHNGRRQRYKVRARHYVETNQSFFEIKFKTGNGHTSKRRVETAGLTMGDVPEMTMALAAWQLPLAPAHLRPTLTNEFSRITLVGKHRPERVTLDLNLQFHAGGHRLALPGLVVAEVKQTGLPRDSVFARQMHAAHIQPVGFSKYCIGAAWLYPELKHNNFKPVLQRINQFLGDKPHVH